MAAAASTCARRVLAPAVSVPGVSVLGVSVLMLMSGSWGLVDDAVGDELARGRPQHRGVEQGGVAGAVQLRGAQPGGGGSLGTVAGGDDEAGTGQSPAAEVGRVEL